MGVRVLSEQPVFSEQRTLLAEPRLALSRSPRISGTSFRSGW